jgi:hypothetical protein
VPERVVEPSTEHTRPRPAAASASGPDRRRRVLHLFVEGEVTEASYADRINDHLGRERRFHLKVSMAGGNPRGLVEAAIQMRTEELPRASDRRDPRRDPEVWCLFDRDTHAEIDGAIGDAARNGVRVAFSHPGFELWLLLHFQQFETQLGGRCAELMRKLHRHRGFRHFDKYVGEGEWAALVGHSEDARKRALQLVRLCPSGCCGPEEHPPHCIPTNRDPSTDVWKLLDLLQLRY